MSTLSDQREQAAKAEAKKPAPKPAKKTSKTPKEAK